eukprot:TRINITY_DN16857_c0_g1_i1.p1 TRINITY_DN16857_c0_g1~~TRINITY_DN16857_c0_g1_i1.p1  ORF type:complete len:214 (+),score=56.34 TRINITY_DN16857_c0_g1_i1:105-746(+)
MAAVAPVHPVPPPLSALDESKRRPPGCPAARGIPQSGNAAANATLGGTQEAGGAVSSTAPCSPEAAPPTATTVASDGGGAGSGEEDLVAERRPSRASFTLVEEPPPPPLEMQGDKWASAPDRLQELPEDDGVCVQALKLRVLSDITTALNDGVLDEKLESCKHVEPAEPDASDLQAQLEKLRGEMEALRAENAALKQENAVLREGAVAGRCCV